MIRVVSWNICKLAEPWRELAAMARDGNADVALLQEAGSPPAILCVSPGVDDDAFPNRRLYDRWTAEFDALLTEIRGVFRNPNLYDRWCLVVPLSDKVRVERFRQVPPIRDLGERDIGVSGIGTIDAARVTPHGSPEDSFIAVSMYARWMKPHPSTGPGRFGVGATDVSAHRILSDISAFIGHRDPSRHRILAAGDLNMSYGVQGSAMSLPERERTFWARTEALGLEFLGPQAPNGRQAASRPPADIPADTKNVPTYYTTRQTPEDANNQLDYAFASRGSTRRCARARSTRSRSGCQRPLPLVDRGRCRVSLPRKPATDGAAASMIASNAARGSKGDVSVCADAFRAATRMLRATRPTASRICRSSGPAISGRVELVGGARYRVGVARRFR